MSAAYLSGGLEVEHQSTINNSRLYPLHAPVLGPSRIPAKTVECSAIGNTTRTKPQSKVSRVSGKTWLSRRSRQQCEPGDTTSVTPRILLPRQGREEGRMSLRPVSAMTKSHKAIQSLVSYILVTKSFCLPRQQESNRDDGVTPEATWYTCKPY